jgi:hypothetical protein
MQMHVQMFTHQHLRTQGRIDTIVLREIERGNARDGAVMGYSWGVGVGAARADGARVVRSVPDVREIRPPQRGDLYLLAVQLAPMVDVWKRLLAQHVPDRTGRCVVCTKGGTGLPSTPWPCSIHSIAEMARLRHDEERTDRPAV